MLHKNVIEKKCGFRELTDAELVAVSGGGNIIVTGTREDDGWVSVSAEDMMYLYPELFGNNLNQGTTGDGGGGGGGVQDVGFLKDLKDWLEENAEWLAEKLRMDLITPEKEAVLNNELNSKEISSITTVNVEGEKWTVVTTTDGQTYYDRDGNGFVDLKSRYTALGVQYDTGDGNGWSIPQEPAPIDYPIRITI